MSICEFPEPLACGHHHSLLVKSVESDYQYCELCETKDRLRDALEMERHLSAKVAKRDEIIQSVLDDFEAADDERLAETDRDHTEAAMRNSQDDMYGWNFFEGKASGTVQASLYYNRVERKLRDERKKLNPLCGKSEAVS